MKRKQNESFNHDWISKYEDIIIDDPHAAYFFAKKVPNANIEKLQKFVLNDPHVCYLFARDIPGADIDKLFQSVKGTIWERYFAEEILKKMVKEMIELEIRRIT